MKLKPVGPQPMGDNNSRGQPITSPDLGHVVKVKGSSVSEKKQVNYRY